jgi:N utilization substance protein B
MRIESRARARALQAFYAWDVRGNQSLTAVAERVFDDLHVGPGERKIASRLLEQFEAVGAELDAMLSDVTSNWRLERLGAIERSVLRLGATELHRRETPPLVVINESVRLAERYGTEASARFVNGVLDALARRMTVL